MAVAFPENFRPLRRTEYDKLVELGAFGKERIELMYGVLVPMSPIGARHCDATDMLMLLLIRALGDRARIRVQHPFAAGDISEPEPDLLVAPLARYNVEHPSIAHLVIEVSESSLKYDRETKLRLYAEQGVPECWIVDVVARRIEVYREPTGSSFESKRVYEPGEVISLLTFPDATIAVAEVLN
jgi:Uma2 family endonuclease